MRSETKRNTLVSAKLTQYLPMGNCRLLWRDPSVVLQNFSQIRSPVMEEMPRSKHTYRQTERQACSKLQGSPMGKIIMTWNSVTIWTRSALGRAHVPPTKVFRRLARHSRVDYCNAVFAVSRRYITDIIMKIRNAQQFFCSPRRLLSVSMYFGTQMHRKLPFVSKRGSR